MSTEIENLRPFVSELHVPEDFEIYGKDVIVLDYGTKLKDSEKISQLKITYENPEDKLIKVQSTCGCTTPKITDVDEHTQILQIGYNTGIVGTFTKTISSWSKDKKRKQIFKIKGKIVRK